MFLERFIICRGLCIVNRVDYGTGCSRFRSGAAIFPYSRRNIVSMHGKRVLLFPIEHG